MIRNEMSLAAFRNYPEGALKLTKNEYPLVVHQAHLVYSSLLTYVAVLRTQIVRHSFEWNHPLKVLCSKGVQQGSLLAKLLVIS